MTVQKLSDSTQSIIKKNPAAERRERIVRRVALEFKHGMYGILRTKIHFSKLEPHLNLLYILIFLK